MLQFQITFYSKFPKLYIDFKKIDLETKEASYRKGKTDLLERLQIETKM